MVTSIILAFEYIGMSTAVATFAANFALSYVVTRVFGSNTSNQQVDNGVRLQVPPSTVNAIPVVYGDAYLGGTFVDAALTENQRKMYYVLAVSSISPNGTFTFDRTDMYYGDRLITFESGSGADLGKVVTLTDEAGNADPKISGNLYIYLFTSNDAGVITPINSAGTLPSGIMGSASGLATAQQWPTTGRQMNGTAFAIVVLNYNRDADTTSLQPITFKVSHNLNGLDRARPGDVWYDYMTSTVYGGAIDPAYVDTTTQGLLNTYSDALITYTNSGGSPATQRRYKINGVLDAGETVINNVDRIMSACDSWMTYNAASGKWAVVVNKSETTAYAFNDNNIIGEIRVSATDISSSINQVEARFPFKESRDQAAFVNLETPPALLYPNEPVNKYSVTYDLVNDSVQATYLANRVLEQSREDLIVNFNTTYYGIQVEAGDVVSVTNTDYGWCAPTYPDGKPFRVMKVNEAAIGDGTLGARLELSEYNADVYDDKDITQFAPVANSGLVSPIYFSPLSAPVVVASYPSASVPSFDLQITTPVTGRAVFANIYYSTTPTPTTTDLVLLYYTQTSDNKPAAANTAIVFPNFVLPSGTYYFVFNVGNNDSISSLSAVSSAFVWNPTANVGPFVDISGFTGFTKNSAGTVITPSSSTLTAVVQNVTSPTYSWVITGATPTTGSSSTITITPSLSASSVTASLTVSGTNLTTPIVRTITMPITLDGSGAAGLNSATVYLYNKNTSTTPPALFSGTFTYTFNTGVLSTTPSGVFNGWAQTPPSIAAGEFLFLSLATASSTAATDTIATAEFSTPQVISGTGTNGANTAIVSLFQANTSAVTPPSSPTGTFTYTFSTAVLSGGTLNGWDQSVPTLTAGQYLWQKQATAFSSASTDTIAASEFSGAVVVGGVGVSGNSFRIAYYTQSQSLSAPSVSPNPTSGNASFPTSVAWSGTITAPAAGQSLWAIDGTYVVSTNQTTWSAPYLTQGFPTTIQSDNYVFNTSGWQIQRDTGNAYFNNGFFRGNITGGSNIEITGSAKFNGAVTTTAGTSAITANVTFGQRYGLIAYADNSPYNPVIQTAAVYGVGNGNAPGIQGVSYGAGGVGVVGFGDLYGLEGNCSGVGGVGVRGYGYASNGTGVGGVAYGTGPGVYGNSLGGGPAVWCDGIFKWSTYSIAVPTGSSSDVLRGNGTWGAVSFATNATYADYLGGVIAGSWARIFATNSGTANAAGSGVNLLGSTSTGIAGAYVGTSGTSNIVTFTVQTTSPSDVRLKEEIADSDLGLDFVKQLRPVSYKLKADPKHQKGYGFIADEVEEIIELGSSLVYHEPDWKVGDETGFKTIHYPSYIAVLTKAIQELTAKVEALENQLKG